MGLFKYIEHAGTIYISDDLDFSHGTIEKAYNGEYFYWAICGDALNRNQLLAIARKLHNLKKAIKIRREQKE